MGFQDETITEIMNSCEQYRPKLIRYCSQFFQYEPDYLDVMVGDAVIEQKALEILRCLSPQERDLYYDYYIEQKSLKAIARKWVTLFRNSLAVLLL